MKYIRRFKEIRKEDVPIVGGKGANLGEMFNAGLPVPDGFCVTGDAFDEYMKRNGFDQQASAYSETLRSEIAEGQLWQS